MHIGLRYQNRAGAHVVNEGFFQASLPLPAPHRPWASSRQSRRASEVSTPAPEPAPVQAPVVSPPSVKFETTRSAEKKMPSLLSLGAAWLGLATIVLAACNGQDALCSRAYSNVTFVGSHNSAFVGLLPSQNQLVSVEDQLGLGVRFLQAQTHDLDGTIEMCHTSCVELDAGTLTDYLKPIKTFMDANPNEVVTLLL